MTRTPDSVWVSMVLRGSRAKRFKEEDHDAGTAHHLLTLALLRVSFAAALVETAAPRFAAYSQQEPLDRPGGLSHLQFALGAGPVLLGRSALTPPRLPIRIGQSGNLLLRGSPWNGVRFPIGSAVSVCRSGVAAIALCVCVCTEMGHGSENRIQHIA